MTAVAERKKPDVDERFEKKMTFSEHLDELRGNLIRSAAVLAGLFVVGLAFRSRVESFVMGPYESVRAKWAEQGRELPPLTSIDVMEPMFFTMKAVFYASLVIGTPYLLYEMWRFISAGLYARERMAVMRVLPVSLALFFAGAWFSYELLIPISVEVMVGWAIPEFMRVAPRPESYLSFFLIFTLMLGVVFQLPLIQVVLARFGILSAAKQASWRRGFIMTAVVAAAVITPTGDPFTLSLVAVPMWVLYEIGILIGRRVKPRDAAG